MDNRLQLKTVTNVLFILRNKCFINHLALTPVYDATSLLVTEGKMFFNL